MRRWPLIILLIGMSISGLIFRYSLFFNIRSDSMPMGIYRRVKDKPGIGSVVASCLTKEIALHGLERGYLMKGNCPSGIQPVLKKVFAVHGDLVSVEDGYVSINGKVHLEFPVASLDSQGRLVKQFNRKGHYLKDGEYYLLSGYKLNSWDSRYFGSVPVNFVLKPLVVIHE
ncbi:MAG: hypothetical protein COV72_02350 [Candidatus Omnitrophica bacterium CG11_big_fil_rev_8_21_14_0_20_42_13]|uniref:Peptidase S26 domain-containing protein n=1 Tax=Candidatus Ghiorseimicrobium undicola TaxID=1974746 RepID=A0A2H0LYV7_9BACT|nr:MAG: hypothetical protein COV72_02350 [Candidatus Omnitrophica bacterium CG11_big_fil_rev_8_21_14_0_20_42_13]